MNIKRAKEEIKSSIRAYLAKDAHGNYVIPQLRQRPLFLIGPPGIGKTQIMEQVARECQVGLLSYTITHHTRQSAIGLPFIAEKSYGGEKRAVTEYTMSEIVASIYDRIESTGLSEGILFIDEINCASETLAPTMLQFLQCKTFGNHKIPAGWMIVTAGNPPEYNKSVREFDIATLDRIKKIEVEADFTVWKEYAYQAQVHPAVIAYLTAKPAYFYQIETTVEGRRFATPRGWEDLSSLIKVYEELSQEVDREVVLQYIQHPKIAKDFANYLELYYKYQTDYRIDEILEGRLSEQTILRLARAPFDEKLSVIGLLLARLNAGFQRSEEMAAFLEELLAMLLKWRELLSESDAPPHQQLAELTGEVSRQLQEKKRAGLLSRGEEYRMLDVLARAEGWQQLLLREQLQEAEEAIQRLRSEFAAEREQYEQQTEEALGRLEHAFDFMEAVFGDSQELVIFLTELNTNCYSVSFLRENECERYYEYNRRLLFEDREEELRRRIAQL